MSVFLDVLNWVVIAGGTVGAVLETAAWVALAVACCLLCIALSWEVRSLLRSRSGPVSDGAMIEPS